MCTYMCACKSQYSSHFYACICLFWKYSANIFLCEVGIIVKFLQLSILGLHFLFWKNLLIRHWKIGIILRLYFFDLTDFAYVQQCPVGRTNKFSQALILRLRFLIFLINCFEIRGFKVGSIDKFVKVLFFYTCGFIFWILHKFIPDTLTIFV